MTERSETARRDVRERPFVPIDPNPPRDAGRDWAAEFAAWEESQDPVWLARWRPGGDIFEAENVNGYLAYRTPDEYTKENNR